MAGFVAKVKCLYQIMDKLKIFTLKRINTVVAQVLIAFYLLSSGCLSAQFAPPAGQEGSTAIKVDSSVFVAWASSCVVSRGWMQISDTSLGKVTYGTEEHALGVADNAVVSLGDGGEAVLFFDYPLVNGEGWDFAVFENGFNDEFLELAWVEVSSNGVDFFRFPSVSLTQTEVQVDGFGTLQAEQLYDFAGKYRAFYGTPFDLEEMKDVQGLNVDHIVAIKVVDVVGCIEDPYATYDSEGNKINDPWPTPFETGGFDLDAVGVINNTVNNSIAFHVKPKVCVYPNPCSEVLNVEGSVTGMEIYNMYGELLMATDQKTLDVSFLSDGFFLVKVVGDDANVYWTKILKRSL